MDIYGKCSQTLKPESVWVQIISLDSLVLWGKRVWTGYSFLTLSTAMGVLMNSNDCQIHKLNVCGAMFESASIWDHKHLFIEPSGRRNALEFINTPHSGWGYQKRVAYANQFRPPKCKWKKVVWLCKTIDSQLWTGDHHAAAAKSCNYLIVKP